MGYEMIAEQIATLPEAYISELSDFIVYLKLKAKFQDFETLSYENALLKWREDSKELFANKEDAAFIQKAFENRSKEVYVQKEIW